MLASLRLLPKHRKSRARASGTGLLLIPALLAPSACIQRRAPAEPPQIRLGATKVSGRLNPELIRKTVREAYASLRLCFEDGLRRNPQLTGSLLASFVISRDGTVGSAFDAGSDLPDPEVIQCVLAAIQALRFPQPDAGIVEVSYPITLTPGTLAPR
jgi:hypothetical protein